MILLCGLLVQLAYIYSVINSIIKRLYVSKQKLQWIKLNRQESLYLRLLLLGKEARTICAQLR